MADKGKGKSSRVLRERAEEILRSNREGFSGEMRLKFEELLHELHVHQIELEMQNEELDLSRGQLEISRNKYLELFENAPVGYLICNEGRVIVDVNDTALGFLSKKREELTGNHCTMFVEKADRNEFFRHIEGVFETGERKSGEFRIITGTEKQFDVEVHSSLIREEADGRTYCLSAFFDVSERKAMQKALAESEERYRTVADYTYDWESWIGPDGSVLYVSPACKRISGYSREAFIENPGFLHEIVHPDDLAKWKRFMTAVGPEETLDYRIIHEDGGTRWVSQARRRVFGENGGDLGIRSSIRDITKRKEMEIQLRFQALHDHLTGLPNRTLCRDRLRHALERSRRRRRYVYSLIYLDMDKFKQVNDTLGHDAGDKFLVEVSKRLMGCIRGLDTVSRFGGDEFVILLEELPSHKEGTGIAMRILKALREPFYINGNEVRSSGSLGMALGNERITDPDELVRRANIAMHRAKEHGRNRFKVFNAKMQDAVQRLADFGKDMRRALSDDEFFFELQPLVDLNDLSVMGFEVLSRWDNPKKGLIDPMEFIPVAEETGLIVELGRQVLTRACEIGSGWLKRKGESRRALISVNISKRELYTGNFVDIVAEALNTCGAPTDMLCLEFSESTVSEDEIESLQRLEALKRMGVKLALDDFGVGASSINSLKKFPFDLLKIDVTLSNRVDEGPAGFDSVKAIVELAHSLGMSVIAEGVSDKSHFELLREIGCEYGQGYFFAKPLNSDEADALFESGMLTGAA